MQGAGGAHKALEGLRKMRGVQRYEAHAAQDSVVHALNKLVGHFVVRLVSPPDEHIGIFEHFGRQTAVGVVEGRGAHLDILLRVEKALYLTVDSVGINCRYLGRFDLMDALVPDGNSYHFISSFREKFYPSQVYIFARPLSMDFLPYCKIDRRLIYFNKDFSG